MMTVHGAVDGAHSDPLVPAGGVDLNQQAQATDEDVTITLLADNAAQDPRVGITMRLHGQSLHFFTDATAAKPWTCVPLATEDLTVNAVGASTLSLASDEVRMHISYNDTHKRDFWRCLVDSPASNGPVAPLHAILVQVRDSLHTFDVSALGMAAHAMHQVEAHLRLRAQEDESVRLDASCATIIKDTVLDSIEQAFVCEEQQLDIAGVLAGCRDWLSSQAAVLDRHGQLHQARLLDPPVQTDAHALLRSMTAVTCSAMDERACAILVAGLPKLLDAIASETQETSRTKELLSRARGACEQLTQLTQHTQPSMFQDLSTSEQDQVRALHYSRVASVVVNVLRLLCSEQAEAPPFTPLVSGILDELASAGTHCRSDVLKQFARQPKQLLPRFNVRALGGNVSYDQSDELIDRLRKIVDSNPGLLDGAKSSQLLLSDRVAYAQEHGADHVDVDKLRYEFQTVLVSLAEFDPSMCQDEGKWSDTRDAGVAAAVSSNLDGSVMMLLEKMQEVSLDLVTMAEAIIQEQQHLLNIADTKQVISSLNASNSGYGLPGDVLPGSSWQLQDCHIYDSEPSYLGDNANNWGNASSDGSDTHLSDGVSLYDSCATAVGAGAGSGNSHDDDDDADDGDDEVFTNPDSHPNMVEGPVPKPQGNSKPTPPPRAPKHSSLGGSPSKPVPKPRHLTKELSRARNLTRHRLKRSTTSAEESEATETQPQTAAEPLYMPLNPLPLPSHTGANSTATTMTAPTTASSASNSTAAAATTPNTTSTSAATTTTAAPSAAGTLPMLSSAGLPMEAHPTPTSTYMPGLRPVLSRLPSQGGSTANTHTISQVARKAIEENSLELMCGVVWLHRLYVPGSAFVTEVVQIMHDLHALKDQAMREQHTKALFSLVSILCEEGHLPMDLYRPLIHLLTSPSMAQLLPQTSSLLFKVMSDYQRVTVEEKERAHSLQLMHSTDNKKRKGGTLQKLKRRSKAELYVNDPYTVLRKQDARKLAQGLTAWHNACFRSIPAQEFPLLRTGEAPHKTRFRQQVEAVRLWVAQVLAGFYKGTPIKDVQFFVMLATELRSLRNLSLFEAVQGELLKMEQTDMQLFTKKSKASSGHQANRVVHNRGSSKLTNMALEYCSSGDPCIPTQRFLFDEVEAVAREEAASAVQQNASFKLQRPVDLGRLIRMVSCMEQRMDCSRADYDRLRVSSAIKEVLNIVTNESTVVAGTGSSGSSSGSGSGSGCQKHKESQ